MTAWWRDAAIHQVYVRSFADGDGDGSGDLIGVRDRLPYLAGLGVDAGRGGQWCLHLFDSALPDSVSVYQGEELGLPEVLDLPAEMCPDPQRPRDAGSGRDGCRVPLPWTRDDGWRSLWPPIPADWAELTVEARDGVTGSTLELVDFGVEGELLPASDVPGAGDSAAWWKVKCEASTTTG
ncbi:hypothetical protein [Nonomuraea sp. NPDC050786]|uniref:alpha-amylase family glycosyl hydrolase n=1 Tax=Nonomuraea sp. NPDC050786 TaxID=3154840 RepID=UPI0033F5DCFB